MSKETKTQKVLEGTLHGGLLHPDYHWFLRDARQNAYKPEEIDLENELSHVEGMFVRITLEYTQ